MLVVLLLYLKWRPLPVYLKRILERCYSPLKYFTFCGFKCSIFSQLPNPRSSMISVLTYIRQVKLNSPRIIDKLFL